MTLTSIDIYHMDDADLRCAARSLVDSKFDRWFDYVKSSHANDLSEREKYRLVAFAAAAATLQEVREGERIHAN